jgi:multicomponent Na+:H+ antiporter subunit E
MAAPTLSPRRRLIWAAEVFVGLFAVWLALNAWTAWPLGLAVAALGAVLGAALVPGQPSPWRPWRLLSFAAFFLRGSLLGGLDVARRALHPRLPVSPRLVDFRLELGPGPARTLMISLVSLLPGSLSADLDAERGILRVHLLAADADAGLAELQSRIAQLFQPEPP